VALLFADLFYEGLARADGEASIARLLRNATAKLRSISRDRATRWFESTLARCDDIHARAALQEFLQDLPDLEGRPFAHPYFWAAYHVSGDGTLRVRLHGAAAARPPRESIASQG